MKKELKRTKTQNRRAKEGRGLVFMVNVPFPLFLFTEVVDSSDLVGVN